MPIREPLVVMTPKSLLHHPDAKSKLADMGPGTSFRRIIPEPGLAAQNPSKVKKLLFSCGKIYYDQVKERTTKDLDAEIAISRIEQISPFPFDIVRQEIEKYPGAEIEFVQKEHKNMGTWTYVKPRQETVVKKLGDKREIGYVGHYAAASTATGNKYAHIQEQVSIMKKAFHMNDDY